MNRPFSTLENPFAEQKQRKTDDAKFVGDVLGPEAEKAMRKVVPNDTEKTGHTEESFALTDQERRDLERAKRGKEVEKPWTHEQLVSWAKEIGKDEAWVKRIFTFEADGTIVVYGDLNLQDLPVHRLPAGLVEIVGSLSLIGTPITSCKSFPKMIAGRINLNSSRITSLKGLPNIVNGDLILTGIPASSLNGISKKIHGDLCLLAMNKIISVPEGLEIDGCILLYSEQEYVREDAKQKGYNVRIRADESS